MRMELAAGLVSGLEFYLSDLVAATSLACRQDPQGQELGALCPLLDALTVVVLLCSQDVVSCSGRVSGEA
jgi:hypothetical protein